MAMKEKVPGKQVVPLSVSIGRDRAVARPTTPTSEQLQIVSKWANPTVMDIKNIKTIQALYRSNQDERRRHIREVQDGILAKNPHITRRDGQEIDVSDDSGLDFSAESTLFYFTETNPVRLFCIKIVRQSWFDTLIISCIILNCIFLCIGNPICMKIDDYDKIVDECGEEEGKMFLARYYAEFFFMAVFGSECILKIISLGLVMPKTSYLRSPWNVLDFVVVISAFMSLVGGGNMTALRVLRVLRPLRTLSSIPGMQVIVKSMLVAIPALSSVLIVCAFTFFVFSIIGVQLWAGLFNGVCQTQLDGLNGTGGNWSINELVLPRRCELDFSEASDCDSGDGFNTCRPVYNGYNCPSQVLLDNVTYSQRCKRESMADSPGYGYANYNNLGNALLVTFTGVTLEGWVDTMYAVWDTFGLVPLVFIYYFLLVVFVSLYLMNLALAVIWEEYAQVAAAVEAEEALKAQKAKADESHANRQAWYQVLDKDANKDASEAEGDAATKTGASDIETGDTAAGTAVKTRRGPSACDIYRGKLRTIVSSVTFDVAATSIVILNTAVLAMPYYGMSKSYETGLDIANATFTLIFVLEAILRIVGLGLKDYMADPFNVFDFVVTLWSVIELAVQHLAGASMGGLSAFRLLRAFRLMNVSDKLSGLKSLMRKIGLSVMDVASASFLLFILMFIFALLGIQFFAGEFKAEEYGGEKPRANFDTLWWAFVTVFQVLTGENWNDVLWIGMHVMPFTSAMYFALVNLLGNFVVLNIFIAILLARFDEIDEEEVQTNFEGVFSEEMPEPSKKDAFPAFSGEKQSPDSRNPAPSSVEMAAVNTGSRHDDSKREPPVPTRPSQPTPGGHKMPARGGAYVTPAPSTAAAAGTAKGGAPTDEGGSETNLHLTQRLRGRGGRGLHTKRSKKLTSPPTGPSTGAPASAPLSPSGTGHWPAAADTSSEDSPSDEGSSLWERGEQQMDQRPTEPPALQLDEGPTEPALPLDHPSASKVPPPKVVPPKVVAPPAREAKYATVPSSSSTERVPEESYGFGHYDKTAKFCAVGTVMDDEKEIREKEAKAAAAAAERLAIFNASGKCLYLVGPENPIRVQFFRLVTNPWFDRFILVLIVVSSILLAMDEPWVAECNVTGNDSCVEYATALLAFDIVMTTLFVGEMTSKIVAHGFAVNGGAYLRNGWNVLDFFIVWISVLSLCLRGEGALKSLRSLRALRALRPLRVVQRFPNLRLVVNAMFKTLPKVVEMTLVFTVFYLLFAIVGLQNWRGYMRKCNDPDIITMENCTGTFKPSGETCNYLPNAYEISRCEEYGEADQFERIWESVPANFDNLGNSLLTLFEIASGEMWPDIMYNTVDAVGMDLPMERDNNPAAALYFVASIVVCSFLMLNAFVGVVISNFNQQKREQEGGFLLTEEQQEWAENIKIVWMYQINKPFSPPKFAWRKHFFRVAESALFEWFIIGCIIVNVMLMSMRHYNQSSGFDDFLEYGNLLFTIIFTVEMAIKLIGLGFKQYVSSHWNKFDGVIVLMSYVTFVADVGSLSVFRVLRVIRVVRLIKYLKEVQEVIQTFISALPLLSNIGSLFVLFLFLFAVIGMNLFGHVKKQGFLITNANFDTFFNSMLLLFRCVTGESFNGVMHDCSVQPPYCEAKEWWDEGAEQWREPNCGNSYLAPAYFTFFFTMMNYVFLNMLIAIILDNYLEMRKLRGSAVTNDTLDTFEEAWKMYDTRGKGSIPLSKLGLLLRELPHPWGSKGSKTLKTDAAIDTFIHTRIAHLDLPVHGAMILFNETMLALALDTLGHVTLSAEQRENIRQRMKEKLMANKTALKHAKRNSAHPNLTFTLRQHQAAQKFQKAWHRRVASRKERAKALDSKTKATATPPAQSKSKATDSREPKPISGTFSK